MMRVRELMALSMDQDKLHLRSGRISGYRGPAEGHGDLGTTPSIHPPPRARDEAGVEREGGLPLHRCPVSGSAGPWETCRYRQRSRKSEHTRRFPRSRAGRRTPSDSSASGLDGRHGPRAPGLCCGGVRGLSAGMWRRPRSGCRSARLPLRGPWPQPPISTTDSRFCCPRRASLPDNAGGLWCAHEQPQMRGSPSHQRQQSKDCCLAR